MQVRVHARLNANLEKKRGCFETTQRVRRHQAPQLSDLNKQPENHVSSRKTRREKHCSTLFLRMTVSTSGLQRLQNAWGCCVSAAFGEMTRFACARTQPGLCRTAARGHATLLRFALTLYYPAFLTTAFHPDLEPSNPTTGCL